MSSRLNNVAVRVAAWADHWLIPFVVGVLLISDFAVGLILVVSPPPSFSSPVYDTAKRLFSLDAYGLMLMLSVLIASAAFATAGRSWITGWLTGPLIAGQWVFWSVLFATGAHGRVGGSLIPSVFALTLASLHLLAGLGIAVSSSLPGHRPSRRATDPRR